MQGIMQHNQDTAQQGFGPEAAGYASEQQAYAPDRGRWGHDGYAEHLQDEPAEGPSHHGHSGRYREDSLQEPSSTVFVKVSTSCGGWRAAVTAYSKSRPMHAGCLRPRIHGCAGPLQHMSKHVHTNY